MTFLRRGAARGRWYGNGGRRGWRGWRGGGGRDFDLSECVALFGICLREHCGIGGVCFWDSA